jgi:type I restriction enzyme S subunit
MNFSSVHLPVFCSVYRKKTKGAGQATITVEDIREFTIPLPPIEKQREIVELLDNFSKLCDDISEGLPAEIDARQKQYEYYRDKLLTFKQKQ